MRNLRLRFSEKILDCVDALPRFRAGFVSDLQETREFQRKAATDKLLLSKAPEGARIEFNRMLVMMTVEHEEFSLIVDGFSKAFVDDASGLASRFVDNFQSSIDDLHSAGWHNVTTIVRDNSNYFPQLKMDPSLPNHIDQVSIFCHRLLPSLACLVFELKLNSSFAQRLMEIHSREHLPPVTFTNFFPLNRFHHSLSYNTDIVDDLISEEKNSLRLDFKRWVNRNFSGLSKISFSYIDVATIYGAPDDKELCSDWMVDNRHWLSTFGLRIVDLQTYEGEGFIISKFRSLNNFDFNVSCTVAKTAGQPEYHGGYIFDPCLNSILLSTVLSNFFKSLELALRKYRSAGFKKIFSKNLKKIDHSSDILNLKRLLVKISRLKQEFEESFAWIAKDIGAINPVRRFGRKKPDDYSGVLMNNLSSYVKSIEAAAKVVDDGMTSFLSVQSISAMYKLQRRIYFLTIVVTLATIVGVLANWRSLAELFTVFRYFSF
jgi:hypothetical protein